MHKIAVEVEQSPEYLAISQKYFEKSGVEHNMSTAIARAAYVLARTINARAILTPTLRGNTPKLISQYRPPQEILAVTPSEEVQRNLLLYWGVYPILCGVVSDSSDAMLNNAISLALKNKYIRNDDRVITVAGIPLHSPVMLNMIRVHVISTILAKGQAGVGKFCTGRIVKVNNLSEAVLKLQGTGNEILLIKSIDMSFRPLVPKLRGLIVEDPTTFPPEEMLLLNPQLVMIAGVPEALQTFEPDLIVSMDGEEQLIYEGVVEEK